jgi:hypothetical protein
MYGLICLDVGSNPTLSFYLYMNTQNVSSISQLSLYLIDADES